MPTIPKKRATTSTPKQVACTHCDEISEVGQKAMSVFCPHCKKRLILEDFKITTYHGVREFATCGDVVVEKRGHICALVKASNLTVKGKIQGNVIVRGKVTVHKTASLAGDLQAPSLLLEGGAKLNGFLRIGAAATETPESTAATTAAATAAAKPAARKRAPAKPRRKTAS